MLETVEGFLTRCRSVRVVFDPAGHLGVEIPAEIVEPWFRGKTAYLRRIRTPEPKEAEDHVRDLDAGVVDVGLNFDPVAQITEDPGESVTEGGVPEMADVRRLVRIDAGVLDDVDAVRCSRADRGQRLPDPHFPVEEDIDVSGTGHFHPSHLGTLGERTRQRLGDLPGWTPQVAR